MCLCSDFMPQYFEPLKEFFGLDPLMAQVVIYICPKASLAEVVCQMDLNLSLAWLIHVANRRYSKVCSII